MDPWASMRRYPQQADTAREKSAAAMQRHSASGELWRLQQEAAEPGGSLRGMRFSEVAPPDVKAERDWQLDPMRSHARSGASAAPFALQKQEREESERRPNLAALPVPPRKRKDKAHRQAQEAMRRALRNYEDGNDDVKL
mmetsp:Transcript_44133/g.87103  ORF Transcript_44133/g.87103 Transcript_44133/m.87103 type:complete len:140 (+) Transcript_44133:2-421(+)